LKTILGAIGELFAATAEGKLKIAVEAVPLAEVEAAWDRVEKGRRIVFTV
jgi:D-arabinose 1-dehydrogenase-like Zn-dependent alcohol dehydrogenase